MCPYIWYTIEEFELASDIFNFKSRNIVIRHEKGGGVVTRLADLDH